MLEEYLWHFVLANEKNWVNLLNVAQFCHYLHTNSSIGKSPFKLAMRRQPLMPLEAVKHADSKCPTVARLTHNHQECIDEARDCLTMAQWNIKRWANVHQRPLEFQAGDKVLLQLTPQIIRRVSKKEAHWALVQCYMGPFVVEKRVGNLAYKLDLLARLRLHPIFHVSLLKKFYKDHEDLTWKKSYRTPPQVRTTFDKKAKAILDRRVEGIGRHEYTTFLPCAMVGTTTRRSHVGAGHHVMAIWGPDHQLPEDNVIEGDNELGARGLSHRSPWAKNEVRVMRCARGLKVQREDCARRQVRKSRVGHKHERQAQKSRTTVTQCIQVNVRERDQAGCAQASNSTCHAQVD